MKFEKFLKSLGGHGIIFTKGTERWLASTTVCAKIPTALEAVIAEKVVEMPETIRYYIDYDMYNDPCELTKAIIPIPDGGIKDCIRVYTAENGIEIPIDNNEYSLIENSDITEINIGYNGEVFTPQVLVVRKIEKDPDKDAEIVAIIYPSKNIYKEEK